MQLLIFRSFRSRISALVIGLVTLALTATLAAVMMRAHAEVKQQAAQQLSSAAGTAREMLEFRGNQLTNSVEVLTSDFGFKEAVDSDDTATLVSAMNNQRARIGADAVFVLDTDGRSIASTSQNLSASTRSNLQQLITSDSAAELLRLFCLIDGQPHQLVLAPVLAPDRIGWTAMAFALDDKVASEMARVLGVEVSFVASSNETPISIASSLAAPRRGDLALASKQRAMTPFTVSTAADQFLTWTNVIHSNNGSLTLVLQRSMSAALRPYELLRQSILGIGAAALAGAYLLAALLARSATRPIDALTEAAARLEAGDYSADVPSAGTDELSRLAAAFNAMRTAVAEREAAIRHQSLHDALTTLPTRVRMTHLLESLLPGTRQASQILAVCLIEIQQFQEIIASLGHTAGDQVLLEVARRLSAHATVGQRVARMATDQFLVVLDVASASAARVAAEHIVERLRVAFDYSGVSLQLETRVGVVTFPDDGSDSPQLLQRAELALYRAKETRAEIGMFVKGDDEVHRQRMSILGDLRQAIASEQLELHYQPKVSLLGGRVAGCEALVRWRHPDRGMIPPGDFIPHAERTGMIRLLTAWVLKDALSQLRAWQMAGIVLDVSVNVSPSDLADPGFTRSVMDILHQTGANPRQLMLEVTESAAMADLSHASRVMENLRVLGVRFSIDDFGTGYSSLAHLKRLPVDEIKIDQSFIRELEARPGDDVVVRSTINLGHALGLKVVAEGVELPTSFEALTQLGCDMVQGYYVAKPLPPEEFARWAIAREAEFDRTALSPRMRRGKVGQSSQA